MLTANNVSGDLPAWLNSVATLDDAIPVLLMPVRVEVRFMQTSFDGEFRPLLAACQSYLMSYIRQITEGFFWTRRGICGEIPGYESRHAQPDHF